MASGLASRVGKGILAGQGYVVTMDIQPSAIAGENPAEVIQLRTKKSMGS